MDTSKREWLKARLIYYFTEQLRSPRNWWEQSNPTNAANHFIHYTKDITHDELYALAEEVINTAKVEALLQLNN